MFWLLLVACSDKDPGTETALVCDAENEDCDIDSCSTSFAGKNMLPGSDCMACHNADQMPPPPPHGNMKWTAAGTLYESAEGLDGYRSATVIVTDAEGTTVEMTTSRTGNFHTSDALVFPITAAVVTDNATLTMPHAVDNGSCNTCHACDGEVGQKLNAK